MIWERQQLANLEGLLLRARHVRATGALTCVLTTHKNSRKSILVTDGAPCYPKLTCENNLGREACIIVREYVAPRREKHGAHYLCTEVVSISMECG